MNGSDWTQIFVDFLSASGTFADLRWPRGGKDLVLAKE